MGYKHGTPGRRLFRFLLDGRGTRTVMEISRRQADGRLLKDAWKELDGLIVEEEGRSARTKRPSRRICLTMKGWAAATFYRPGFVPARLSTDVLKRWFKELQKEGDEWANSFERENAVLREKLAEFERLKREGMIYPSPRLRKVRTDAKNPQAMLERDLRREAREAKKKAPGVPKSTSPAPVAGDQQIAATAPDRYRVTPATPACPIPAAADNYYTSGMRAQSQVLSTIHEPQRAVRNAPKPTDPVDDARILARFHSVPFPGELQPDGKTVRFDGRLYSLRGWEIAYFKQSE